MPLDQQVEVAKKTFRNKMLDIKPGANNVSFKLAAYWLKEIELCDEAQNKWVKRCKTIVKRYRDERNQADTFMQRRMNLLWTNIQIMRPAVFSNNPEPVVERKFLDRDPNGRLSSAILERGLKNEVEVNDLYVSVSQAVLDYLLCGRGQVWMRYEPKFGNSESLPAQAPFENDEFSKIISEDDDIEDEERTDDEEAEQLESTGEEVIAERVPVDYIDWRDFYMIPAKARTWKEVQAVAKRVYISKEEAKERFSEEIAESIESETTISGSAYQRSSYSGSDVIKEANDRDIQIYEIWNKTDRRVYWVSTGYKYLCDVKDDPLKLTNFFPCPPALYATFTNDTLVPIPDYMEWQDQAIMIDELTTRIALLTKACKVAGTYDASQVGIKRLFNEATENDLIPVDSWAAHAEAGGVEGGISFLPIQVIKDVISELMRVREQAKRDMDEVTGLSDVIRGTTDSRETLGGIRLKNNNAGTRLSFRQKNVAEFCCDIIKICAEIMCKHFSDETLIKSSGILFDEELDPKQVYQEYIQKLEEKFGINSQEPQQAPQQSSQPPLMPPQQRPMPPQNNIIPFPPQQASAFEPQMLDIKQLLFNYEINNISPEQLIDEKVKSAIALLRDDVLRQYRIEIETDSTISTDKETDRQAANEFLIAVTSYLQQSVAMAAQVPEMVPVLGKLLLFGVRKFRVGRSLESTFNSFVLQMEKKAKVMAANPSPNPEMQKAQVEIQQIMLQGQIDRENDQRQAEIESKRAEHQFNIQKLNDERDHAKAQQADNRQAVIDELVINRSKQEHVLEMQSLDRRAQYEREEHNMKMQELQEKHRIAMEITKEKVKQVAKKPKVAKKKVA